MIQAASPDEVASEEDCGVERAEPARMEKDVRGAEGVLSRIMTLDNLIHSYDSSMTLAMIASP